jgi:hypothetical protein
MSACVLVALYGKLESEWKDDPPTALFGYVCVAV